MDSWEAIEDLIEREKEAALSQFRQLGPAAIGPLRRSPWRPSRMAWAGAAAVVAAVGFILIWNAWPGGPRRRTAPPTPASGPFAESILFHGSPTRPASGRSAGVSPFSRILESAASRSGLLQAPAGSAPRPGANVEHTNPARVEEKIAALVRDDSLERFISRFFQANEEV